MSKVLIAFYSRAGLNYTSHGIVDLKVGNTEVVVNLMKSMLPNATVFRIDTVEQYPKEYKECTDMAQEEHRSGFRPELKTTTIDTTQYDTVILGYPNWWGTMPMACFTFFEANDLNGKKILPFCTNEGSGMGRSVKDLTSLCPGASVNSGLAINGTSAASSADSVRTWLKRNGLSV